MSSTIPREVADGNILLRQWSPADFPFYAAYLADERNAHFYGGVVDAQKAWRHLASLIGHWALRDFGVHAVENLHSSELQGVAGLWQPHGWPCREFVYWFTANAYARGQALIAASLELNLIRAARLAGETITTYIHPENEPALALARKLGGIARGEEPLFDFGLHVRIEYAD